MLAPRPRQVDLVDYVALVWHVFKPMDLEPRSSSVIVLELGLDIALVLGVRPGHSTDL